MEGLVFRYSHSPIFSFLVWMAKFLDHPGEDLSIDLYMQKSKFMLSIEAMSAYGVVLYNKNCNLVEK